MIVYIIGITPKDSTSLFTMVTSKCVKSKSNSLSTLTRPTLSLNESTNTIILSCDDDSCDVLLCHIYKNMLPKSTGTQKV